MRAAFDWLFRNRHTGDYTVAQWPNFFLGAWIVCSLIRTIFDPTGVQGDVLSWVGAAALLVWAGDEVLRGVNPFRRIVGGVVLLGLVASRL